MQYSSPIKWSNYSSCQRLSLLLFNNCKHQRRKQNYKKLISYLSRNSYILQQEDQSSIPHNDINTAACSGNLLKQTNTFYTHHEKLSSSELSSMYLKRSDLTVYITASLKSSHNLTIRPYHQHSEINTHSHHLLLQNAPIIFIHSRLMSLKCGIIFSGWNQLFMEYSSCS